MGRPLTPLVLIALLGCSSEREPPVAMDEFPFDAPAAPVLTPCPAGWVATAAADTTVCEPWPSARTACPAGQAHFPGSAGCELVGTACPAGGVPVDLPAGVPVLHVRSGAAGGDGSEAMPYGRIQSAIDAATVAGTVVAVQPGTYEGPLEIPGGVTVWGACAAETIVSGLNPLSVLAAGDGAGLRNVTVTGSFPGIWVPGTRIDVEDVVIEGVVQVGIYVHDGGAARLSNVVVRGTRPDTTSTVPGGLGISVETGATAELSRVLLEGNHATGLVVSGDGVSVTGADVAIVDTQPATDGALGRGVDIKNGATATFERLVAAGNRGTGVFVEGPVTTATLSDVVVEATDAEELDRTGGRGINVQQGATLSLLRAMLRGNRDGGLVNLSSTVDARDIVVLGTRPRDDDGTFGRGIGVDGDGATLVLRAAIVEANHDIAVFVNGAGASLDGADLVLRQTASQPADGAGGRGLGVQEGAVAQVVRMRVIGNREAGVLANAGAMLDLSDVAVVDTAAAECVTTSCPDFGLGDGIMVAYGSTATIRRFAVVDSVRVGVAVGPESEVDLSDGEVIGNLIGASVQADGFDVRRIQDGVVYRDNGRNLDRSSLPLPEPSASF